MHKTIYKNNFKNNFIQYNKFWNILNQNYKILKKLIKIKNNMTVINN